MSAGNKAPLLALDDRLLISATDFTGRILVITAAGPRHVNYQDFVEQSQAGMFTKAEFDKTIDWRLQVGAEQAFTRALDAVQKTNLLFEKAPVFPTRLSPEPVRPAPVEPTYLSDARDFKALSPATLGLEFICALNVQQGNADWRGRYAKEVPSFTPMPQPPQGETTVEQMRVYEQEHAQWQLTRNGEQARYDRWYNSASPRFLTATGEKANTDERVVVLRQDILDTAAAVGVDLDLPDGDPAALVPVLVKAVQELHAYLDSDVFITRIADQLALRATEKPVTGKKRR